MYKFFCITLSFLMFSAVAETTQIEQVKEKNQATNQPKTTTVDVLIHGLEDKKLLKNAEAFLDILAEKGKPVKNPSYIDYLAELGVEQIQQSLQPFGYYLVEVSMNVDKQADTWKIDYHIKKGEAVIVRQSEFEVVGEGKSQKAYQTLFAPPPLKTGDRLQQETYKSFKRDVTALATIYGYFDADFVKKQVVISEDYQSADIALTYDTGKRYRFGKTTIKQDFLDNEVFRRFVAYKEGDAYDSKSIADVQRDLYNSHYVKIIDVTAEPDRASKTVPVELVITPKKNKKHIFAIGYGTDSGPRTKYSFDWRWVNRRGHQFKFDAYVAQKAQELGAEYRIPAQKPATDYYKIFANTKRIDQGDKESLLWNIGGAYHDKVGHYEREFGLKWQQEDFELGNDGGNIALLTPYAAITYRKVDDPLNTNKGFSLKAEVTGAHTSLLSEMSFLQAVASAKMIRKVGDKHKVKISGAFGKTWVDNFHRLSPAYRFFTGGDRSVRGYRFESIGEKDTSGTNIGGDKMYYASAEYEYFFKDSMAVAVFVDAGDAFLDSDAKPHLGAGVGFHYYSPIGPIRIDIAHGFDELGDTVRLHLNIGSEM